VRFAKKCARIRRAGAGDRKQAGQQARTDYWHGTTADMQLSGTHKGGDSQTKATETRHQRNRERSDETSAHKRRQSQAGIEAASPRSSKDRRRMKRPSLPVPGHSGTQCVRKQTMETRGNASGSLHAARGNRLGAAHSHMESARCSKGTASMDGQEGLQWRG
jgi:hypothetical protein